MSVALVSGTFDPITKGHVDVITRAAGMFDSVVVAVMNNLSKQSRFTPDERRQMAEAACHRLPNVRVVADGGMMLEFFDRIGADVIVRGVRDEKDYAFEVYMADYLRERNPRIDTVFLHADPAMSGISSTEVRKRLAAGESVAGLVPDEILEFLMDKRNES